MDEDEFKGKTKDSADQAEDVAGDVLGDESLRAPGRGDQAKSAYGATEDAGNAAVDDESDTFAEAHDTIGERRPDGAGIGTEDEMADENVFGWATCMVRERPMLALLGAAATGYALAFLLHGKRR